MKRSFLRRVSAFVFLGAVVVPLNAQRANPENAAANSAIAGAPLPSSYVIGVEDVLDIVFWRDENLSSEVIVRPDGKISLPLLNDIHAAGLTPEGLGTLLEERAREFVNNPDAAVMVKQIRSRKVYVVGEVAQPGTVPLTSEMNVLQLIAQVGGFLEHANRGDVAIVRRENGSETRYKFNYNDVVKGKKPEQNIMLRPGDTVLVR